MKPHLLIAAAVLFAGAAHAQTADRLRSVVYRADPAVAAAPPSTFPSARSEAPRDFGMPRTAIERQFASERLDGSLGFLCGLQPKPVTDGAAAAYGVDPHGRFLGVQLRLALR